MSTRSRVVGFRFAVTTSTPIGLSPHVSSSASASKVLKATPSKTIAAARRARAGACVFESEVRGRAHSDREREFRVRFVARACAAGDPALGYSRDRRRILLGDFLRQLRRARHAVPHCEPARCRSLAVGRRSEPAERDQPERWHADRSKWAAGHITRRFPPVRAKRSPEAPGTRPDCCSTISIKFAPSPAICRTFLVSCNRRSESGDIESFFRKEFSVPICLIYPDLLISCLYFRRDHLRAASRNACAACDSSPFRYSSRNCLG